MPKSSTRIIVLDIETDIPEPKGAIEMCEPFLLGVKHYKIEAGHLIPEDYIAFERATLADGVAHIAKTQGLVIGYNLFGFDYVVLRAWLEGTDIIERSVDPLYFLRTLPERPRGLKLHSVCTTLFGEGKLELSGNAVAAWRDGNRNLVIRYNERDCDLVARLWFFLLSADTATIGEKTFHMSSAQRNILAMGGQFASYKDWLSREFVAQSMSVRRDQFVGLNVNPLELAREFDRFVCITTGKAFFSRFIPASDYPSGEDTAPRFCPQCGEYLGDSPYVFKGPDYTRDTYLAASTEVEALWAKLAPELVPLDVDPHFASTGIPRSERSGLRVEDYLGLADGDFESWLNQIRSRDLQIFVPQYDRQIQYLHRRSRKAEEEYALKIGAY